MGGTILLLSSFLTAHWLGSHTEGRYKRANELFKRMNRRFYLLRNDLHADAGRTCLNGLRPSSQTISLEVPEAKAGSLKLLANNRTYSFTGDRTSGSVRPNKLLRGSLSKSALVSA